MMLNEGRIPACDAARGALVDGSEILKVLVHRFQHFG